MHTTETYPEPSSTESRVNEKQNNPIRDKSFQFALSIINLYKHLDENKEWILSKQLLRSGTSIGANIEEALAAESRKDFAHKMHISLKEARETKYWLRLLKESNLVQTPNLDKHLAEIDELISLLIAIIKTTRNR